jgi:hypothetical protein
VSQSSIRFPSSQEPPLRRLKEEKNNDGHSGV